MLGVLVGGFFQELLQADSNLKLNTLQYHFTKKTYLALGGGILFGFGSQLGRGCTSGSALSGMAVLSLGGFVTMMAIFGTAFVFAYFFRKNWI